MLKCQECGVDIKRRRFCSKKCSASFRSKHKVLVTKEELAQDYLEEQMEVVDIASKHGMSVRSVFSYLDRYQLPRRGHGVDFTGRKLGSVLVIGVCEVGGSGKHNKWNCLCDCGAQYIAYSHHLASCQNVCCTQCACQKRRSKEELKTYMWNYIRKSAASRGIEFDIDKQWAYSLFLEQDRKCALSGVPIGFAQCSADHVDGKTTASLDRRDSRQGYVSTNVHWVHKVVNMMKGTLDANDFVNWCGKITQHSAE